MWFRNRPFWLCSVLLSLLLGFALSQAGDTAFAQGNAPKKQFLSLATSSVGGSWYPLGGAMAALISKYYPQINITAEVTGGTNDNLNLLKNNKLELALSTNSQAYQAYAGEGPFKTDKITNFKGLLGGHAIIWQLYTLEKTGIKSIYDLKGKRVSLGAAGSIGNSIGKIVIEAHGLKMAQDWSPEYIGHGEGPGALRDGRLDAVLIISSAPTAAVTDITSTDGDKVVFVNPDPKVLAELVKERPYWSSAVIPGGVYNGHPKDIPGSFGVSTILLASDKVDDATAYAIVKTLLEHHEELMQANALAKEWSRENATRGIKGVIPFQPGAARYLKEQGLL
jgi:uncharacterized protein